MDKSSALKENKVEIGDIKVGENRPFMIGGPYCDPNAPNLFIETAHALKEAGVDALRGGVWKPRTNPYSYQGRQCNRNYLKSKRGDWFAGRCGSDD